MRAGSGYVSGMGAEYLVVAVAVALALAFLNHLVWSDWKITTRGTKVIEWIAIISVTAVTFGIAIQRGVPLLIDKWGGTAFEWTILIGTLIGGVGAVVGVATSIVGQREGRSIVLQIGQVVGIWVVCIGTLMQIKP